MCSLCGVVDVRRLGWVTSILFGLFLATVPHTRAHCTTSISFFTHTMKQSRTADGRFATNLRVDNTPSVERIVISLRHPQPEFSVALAGIQVVLLSYLLGYLVAVTF